MEAVVQRLRQVLTRARARVLFPTLAVAMGISTLVAGIERTEFLARSAGTAPITAPAAAPAAPVQLSYLTARVLDPAQPADAGTSSVPSSAKLDIHVDHARIDAWVQRLTTSARGDFKQSLSRMSKYASMINAKLDARQMPRELVYLAMIESNFNPTARSRVGAGGLWQFMSATARGFGLKVGRGVDERTNPDKSTDAALTYLSQLHNRFGSWYLAAAAYNSGAGTVSSALRRVTGKMQGTDADFFRILKALPRETQDYVPKLIASARVGSDPTRYGL
jgi:membrane-bound lytic murein transglycosylase D